MNTPFYTPPASIEKQLEEIAADLTVQFPAPGEKCNHYPTQRERCAVCRVRHVAGPYCGYCIGHIRRIRAEGKK